MKGILFVLLTLILLLTMPSVAQAPLSSMSVEDLVDDGRIRANDFGEVWASFTDWKGIFDVHEDSYETGWYPVEQWEAQQCSRHLSTELEQFQTSESARISHLIFDLTLTIQGTKFQTAENTFIYEIAWYVHPLEEEISFTLETYDNQSWEEIPDYGTLLANPVTGNSGFYSFESTSNFNQIRIVTDDISYPVPLVQK